MREVKYQFFLIQVVDMTLLLSLAEEEPEPSGDSCASEGVECNNQGNLSLPALELDVGLGGGLTGHVIMFTF